MKTAITCAALTLLALTAPLRAGTGEDFEKGFYLGICKTVIDAFPKGDQKLQDFEFFITGQDNTRIADFTFDKSVEKILVLTVHDQAMDKQLSDKFLELMKKYRKGDVTPRELNEIAWIYYNLIYKSNRDGIKFGYLISQIFAGVNYANSSTVPDAVKSKAVNSLWQNVSSLLLFAPYFFNAETSDKIFFAYINRDIKTITNLSIVIVVTKLKIPVKKNGAGK